MHISEDEFDQLPIKQETTMSKAELRKTHKPIMEKRRRARINHCLNEIKALILEAMNKDPARHSKLEKADILEMAVKHLQNVQRQQLAIAMAADPFILRKFKSGFNECRQEIDRYINQMDGIDGGLKERIKSHLQKCGSTIGQVAHLNFPSGFNFPFMTTSSTVLNANNMTESSQTIGDQNNNARIQIPQGIQLIPSRLPSGELALLVPNSRNLPCFPSAQRPSAFVTVVPSSETSRQHHHHNSPSVSPLEQQPPPPAPSSPQGFRPVQPSQNLEVKNIKFPIFTTEKISPKKIEPLCIITNHNERYKQAQSRPDSADLEENLSHHQHHHNHHQGTKRKFVDGLLIVSPQHQGCPNNSSKKIKLENNSESVPSASRNDNNEGNSDMWRPW